MAYVDAGLPDHERALTNAAVALSAKLDVVDTCDAILDAVQTMFGARSGWISSL